jgi:transposase-like protein
MTDTGSAIADLRSRWHALCDLDRARAVQSIYQAGMSLRELASHLNCSRSLLSYLLRAASAPVEDREIARSGEISTRELVRRAVSSGRHPASISHEAVAFDREHTAIQASRAITDWLDEQRITRTDRVKIIDVARSSNVNSDTLVLGSLEGYLPDIPLDEIIRIFRPGESESEGAHSVAWFSEWLARWSLHGIPDDVVRFRALEIARSAEHP